MWRRLPSSSLRHVDFGSARFESHLLTGRTNVVSSRNQRLCRTTFVKRDSGQKRRGSSSEIARSRAISRLRNIPRARSAGAVIAGSPNFALPWSQRTMNCSSVCPVPDAQLFRCLPLRLQKHDKRRHQSPTATSTPVRSRLRTLTRLRDLTFGIRASSLIRISTFDFVISLRSLCVLSRPFPSLKA